MEPTSGEVIIDDGDKRGELKPRTMSFILDNIFGMNEDTGFYRFYFKKYGYTIDEDTSELAKNTVQHFIDNNALINDIFVNNNYTSATIVGKKFTNNNELEYYISSCSKQDILDIISITHVKPRINKPGVLEYENPYRNNPMITSGDIMDCYNEYKDSMMYE